MCDPTYTGNARNGNSMSGALPNAPISGAFFPAQLTELMNNAYPACSPSAGVARSGARRRAGGLCAYRRGVLMIVNPLCSRRVRVGRRDP